LKRFFYLGMISFLFVAFISSCAQKHKSKRPSPPAKVTQKVGNTTITIKYGQPSVKGRTIGTDLEPMPGKVWRAGANEATVFQVDKDVIVEGKLLPKGKYSFYILQQGGRSWNLIFNKNWDQWGTKYDEAGDLFRIPVRGSKPPEFSEKLTYKISPDGIVSLLWGDKQIDFQVQEKN
jgi:Protein of unknown function (DUF2911)